MFRKIFMSFSGLVLIYSLSTGVSAATKVLQQGTDGYSGSYSVELRHPDGSRNDNPFVQGEMLVANAT